MLEIKHVVDGEVWIRINDFASLFKILMRLIKNYRKWTHHCLHNTGWYINGERIE